MEFNTQDARPGTFYVASGIANLENRGIDRSLFGTQEPDALFWGETIEKLGPKTYQITQRRLHDLRAADAALGDGRRARSTLTLEKRAVLKNTVLKVKDVPLFYLPVFYYPINKDDRATGFLMPIYGSVDDPRPDAQQRVLLGDQPQPGRDVLPRLVLEDRPELRRRVPLRRRRRARRATSDFRSCDEHDAIYQQPDGSDSDHPGSSTAITVSGTWSQQLPGRTCALRPTPTTSRA